LSIEVSCCTVFSYEWLETWYRIFTDRLAKSIILLVALIATMILTLALTVVTV
jgi:hypothetical protein